MARNELIYTKPNQTPTGFVKDYSRIKVSIEQDQVGTLALGFGDEVNHLHIQDVRELTNLIAILKMAEVSLKRNNLDELDWGGSLTVSMFYTTSEMEKYKI